MPQIALPEDLSREVRVRGSSDRTFGLVIAAFFAYLGLRPFVARHTPRPWYVAVAIACAVVALARPAWLNPLNRVWMRFGVSIGKVMNPIFMAVLFYGVVTPSALILRWLGKDLLSLRYDRNAASYWIVRIPPGPAAETMGNQF
jgi:hypothetical protein